MGILIYAAGKRFVTEHSPYQGKHVRVLLVRLYLSNLPSGNNNLVCMLRPLPEETEQNSAINWAQNVHMYDMLSTRFVHVQSII